MRKHQIVAAAVNVDLPAQLLEVHRRALDMPAWAALAPGARPEWLAGLGCFPEREVGRALLALIHLEARARKHILEIAPRELAVARVGCDAKVNIAVGRVGM